MITLKLAREVEMMAELGALLADVHKNLRDSIRPRITSWDIEVFVRNYTESHDGIAVQIGSEGYEYATCISISDEICYGFPRKKPLENGNLVKIDMCIDLRSDIPDSCWTYVVGESIPEIDRLVEVTKKALYIGTEQAQVGNRTGDIGHTIQTYVEGENLAIIRDFIGHGVGPMVHEELAVPHYGEAGKGLRLKKGMVIIIELMVNIGTWKMKMDPNGWTAYTRDGGLSCQHEHTLAITKDGPRILTSQGEGGTYWFIQSIGAGEVHESLEQNKTK